MGNVERLVETLIEATEQKEISWRTPKASEKLDIEIKFRTVLGIFILNSEDKDMVAITKYSVSDKPYAPPTINTVYTEKVSLLILNKVNYEVITQIDEIELEESHRLWTLYKLADRSAKGADKIIDNLINKYKGLEF